jgi:fatty-acyl-CoA synthase
MAAEIPDQPCQVQGERVLTWSDFDRRANGLANAMLRLGIRAQETVAQYLWNCPEYLESFYGALKAAAIPVNTNYRYKDDELAYLWDNADCAAVVFDASFGDAVARLRERVPRVRLWIRVGDDPSGQTGFAHPYEQLVAQDQSHPASAAEPSGDQVILIYTGGTTGQPKGVIWRQEDFFRALNSATDQRLTAAEANYGVVRELARRRRLVGLPASPLMHGAGLNPQLSLLTRGGCTVTLAGRRFDAEDLLTTIARRRVNQISIVGDVFARPILTALERFPDRWDLTSLGVIMSSGAIFTEEVKQRLLNHLDRAQVIDYFSSSEALGMAVSVSAGTSARGRTATFRAGTNTKVLADDGSFVAPGSGVVGRLVVGGFQPSGYYKDPEKSARTFVTIDGQRYSCPGDWATVAGDGFIQILGRGSTCINTGGEKVFPEEVEAVVRTYPGVDDAAVLGLPDDRFGEAVVALVQPSPGQRISDAEVIGYVQERLASYKAPRSILFVESMGRGPNGKVDYQELRRRAEQLNLTAARSGGRGPRRR